MVPLARNSANPISALRSQNSCPILPTTSFVFVSLPFQAANKGQIIIDRVKLSRFELKRRALPWLSLPL